MNIFPLYYFINYGFLLYYTEYKSSLFNSNYPYTTLNYTEFYSLIINTPISHLEGFCGFSGPLYRIVRLESAGFEAHSLVYRVTRDVGAGGFNQVLKAWDN